MFSELLNNFNQLASQHQMVLAALVALSVITLTWGIEKLLETYLFPKQPVIGYVIAVTGSVTMLFIVQHFILHVF